MKEQEPKSRQEPKPKQKRHRCDWCERRIIMEELGITHDEFIELVRDGCLVPHRRNALMRYWDQEEWYRFNSGKLRKAAARMIDLREERHMMQWMGYS